MSYNTSNTSNKRQATMTGRNAVYGDFTNGLDAEVSVMNALLDLHQQTHGTLMPQLAQQFLQKIVMKLTRVAVSPDHVDSWHDISCYAQLIEDSILHGTNTSKATATPITPGSYVESQEPL